MPDAGAEAENFRKGPAPATLIFSQKLIEKFLKILYSRYIPLPPPNKSDRDLDSGKKPDLKHFVRLSVSSG